MTFAQPNSGGGKAIERSRLVCWESPSVPVDINLLEETVPGAIGPVTNLKAVRIPQIGTGVQKATVYSLTASVDPGVRGRTAQIRYVVSTPSGAKRKVTLDITVLRKGACVFVTARRLGRPASGPDSHHCSLTVTTAAGQGSRMPPTSPRPNLCA